MGSSRFRLFHVMPNVWFYKLRDIGRFKESEGRLQRNNSIRDESGTNSFPKCGYHFEVNLKASEDQPPDHPKSQMKRSRSKYASSAFIDSRISIGCSCTTTLGFIWNSGDRNGYPSSESSEEERPVRYYSEQPVLVLQQQNETGREFKEKLDDTDREFKEKLDGTGLESKSGVWRQPSKHVLQYIYNNAAGLPSPVQELDDGGLCGHSGQPDQQPVTTMNGMFELVEHPLTMGASASSSGLHHNDQVNQREGSFLNMNGSQGHCSGLERKNVGRRRRNTEPRNEKIEGKKKQISGEITEPIRKKVDAGQKNISTDIMNFSIDGPKKPGKSIPHLSIRTGQNNKGASSSRLCAADDNTETLFRRSHSSRLRGESSTNQNFKAKVDDDKSVSSAKSLSACHLFCSDKSSSECAEPDEKSAIFDSFVEMKSSYNPHKDFRESMFEMITEKGIHGSHDLEKLLECYLSLNSSEYHDIILKVFKQVTADLKGVKS